MFGSKVADRIYINHHCQSMRRVTLTALKNLVELDWLLASHSPDEMKFDHTLVPTIFLDGAHEKVLIPIQEQLAAAESLLMVTDFRFSVKVMEFLHLTELNELADGLARSFDLERAVTVEDWFSASFVAKKLLRFVSDRMTNALNGGPYLKCCLNHFNCLGCIEEREFVMVFRRDQFVCDEEVGGRI